MANDLYAKIVAGEVRLLTAEEICERLGVSRTTFDRWVRNSATAESGIAALIAKQGISSSSENSALQSTAPASIGAVVAALRNRDGAVNMLEGKIEFPQPDVRIGRSPRWTFETVVAWLEKNSTL